MRTADAPSSAARPEPSLLAWTLSFLGPYRWQVWIYAGLSFVEVALGALAPWPLKAIIDNVLGGQPLPAWIRAGLGGLDDTPIRLLIVVTVAGLALQLGSQIVSAVHTQVMVDTGQRMVLDLRRRLFAALQALPLRHHVHTSTSDAVFRVEIDAYCIDNLVMKGVFPLASAALTLLVMFVILLRLNVTVALLSLVVVPFHYGSLRYYITHLADRAEGVQQLESKVYERLYESFSAIKLVKSFVREAFELTKFARVAASGMDARIDLTWRESLFNVVVNAITIAGTTLVVTVGALAVLDGRLTAGALLVIIAYLQSVYGPLSQIAHTTGSLQQAVASARRVRAIFALEPEVGPQVAGLDGSAIRGHVRFDDVSFGYDERRLVLDRVSFEARPGEVVALVGLTGAGKTTLVSLLPRFYEPTRGRILVDGHDVREYDLSSLRQRIAMVLQESALFSGSVAENLRFGRLEAGDAALRQAALDAHAHEFIIRLPQGYDTSVAESGAGFSGGERQRLGIARAVLKDAPIVILDEPTSALDAISEDIVFNAIRRLREGRTTIVIAHRLSTIRDAHRILVLDGGRIVASGRHDDLLAHSELYRRMCARLSVGRSLDEPETVDEVMRVAQ